MKQYVIDEIRSDDLKLLKSYLDEHHGPMLLNGIYKIPIERGLYAGYQEAHEECQPFYFALELKPDALCCELLVRTDNRIRCDCIAIATREQRNWLIELIDSIFERLSIVT